MKAIVVRSPGDIALREVELAKPGRGEVTVKVRATAICGSDLPRAFQGGAHYYPIILGHEFSGEVIEIGPGTDRHVLGMRVAVAPKVPCGTCDLCKDGLLWLCQDYNFIGSRRDGGLSEYVNVPGANIVELCDALSFEQGAMLEPSTVALHALMRVSNLKDTDVAVLGGGVVGLLSAQMARIMGAREVVVADISPERLLLARHLGFSAVDTRGVSPGRAIAATTGGKGAHVVIEAAGVPQTQASAVDAARTHGEIVYVGSSHNDVVFSERQFESIARKELSIKGSWQSYSDPFPGGEWTDCQHFIASGRLDVDALTSHRIRFEDGISAFDLIRTGRPYMKIMLRA